MEQGRLEPTKMGKTLAIPLLRLKDMLGRRHTVHFQADTPGFENKKLRVTADYILAQMIEAGPHTLVEYRQTFWIAVVFVQQKKGRTVIAEFGGPAWNAGDELLSHLLTAIYCIYWPIFTVLSG